MVLHDIYSNISVYSRVYLYAYCTLLYECMMCTSGLLNRRRRFPIFGYSCEILKQGIFALREVGFGCNSEFSTS